MNKLTQEQLDEMIDGYKQGVIADVDFSSPQSWMFNNDVLASFVRYQEELIPVADAYGLKAPSLSDLFGVEINLTSHDGEV